MDAVVIEVDDHVLHVVDVHGILLVQEMPLVRFVELDLVEDVLPNLIEYELIVANIPLQEDLVLSLRALGCFIASLSCGRCDDLTDLSCMVIQLFLEVLVVPDLLDYPRVDDLSLDSNLAIAPLILLNEMIKLKLVVAQLVAHVILLEEIQVLQSPVLRCYFQL